jgi:hypothetical protein
MDPLNLQGAAKMAANGESWEYAPARFAARRRCTADCSPNSVRRSPKIPAASPAHVPTLPARRGGWIRLWYAPWLIR